jgi:lambda family phage minor tail protein L
MTTLAADIQSLTPTALLEFFIIDLTSLGDTEYYFHAGTNGLSQNVVWQGQTYFAFPAQASGFDLTTNGQLPQPKIALGNVGGSITALILAYKDCVGGKVIRKRTLSKYLDAVNFPGGVNPTADPTAALADDIYVINRKSTETKEVVEFELAAAFDVSGVMLPRRQIVQNLCPWVYRGAECSYSGPPITDANDNVLTIANASTPLEITYFNALAAMNNAQANLVTKTQLLSNANNVLAQANDYMLLSDNYSTSAPTYFVNQTTSTTQAFFAGAVVTISAVYRVGSYKTKITGPFTQTVINQYSIQKWGVNTGALAAATTAQAAAQTAYNTAVTTLATATTAYNTALAALPSNSPIYNIDKCGKRIASCKARFGVANQLTFGGFPGAGTTQ